MVRCREQMIENILSAAVAVVIPSAQEFVDRDFELGETH